MSTTTSKGTGNTTEAGGMEYQPWKLRTKGELVYAKEVRPYPEIATVGRCGQFVFGIATPGYPGGDYRNVDCPDPCGEADAAFIVRAWNSHDSLLAELAALKASNAALVGALKTLHERLVECSKHPISAEEAYDSFYQDEVSRALRPLDTPKCETCGGTRMVSLGWETGVDGHPAIEIVDNCPDCRPRETTP